MLARPEHWGAAVAALGEGVRERSGPKAALKAMKAAKPLDLSDPIQVEALAAIVEDLAATGRAKEGLALVDAGLRKHPDDAAFLAVRGRALQLSGAPVASVREAFERALALDAKNGRALVGLARLEADAGAKEAALALYDRALATDANEATAAREAASGAGRRWVVPAKPSSGWRLLLEEHPYDAGAARALAELRLARGENDERTLELARRAVAFGGGVEAEDPPRADRAARRRSRIERGRAAIPTPRGPALRPDFAHQRIRLGLGRLARASSSAPTIAETRRTRSGIPGRASHAAAAARSFVVHTWPTTIMVASRSSSSLMRCASSIASLDARSRSHAYRRQCGFVPGLGSGF